MEPHIILFGGLGLLILLVAWVPTLDRNLPVSLPIICILIGFGFFSLVGEDGLHPRDSPKLMEIATEITVIISLAGAGLRVDRQLIWHEWASTVRLLGITMPLTIAAIAGLAAFYLGLPWETAVLIGAVLAPTDPVLAADVQVGPPGSGPEDEVRFSLTSEAGLNDGLAFPFTYLALGIALHGTLVGEWTWHWLSVDVFWRIAAGAGAGWLFGWLLGIFMFRGKVSLASTGQGFAALGGTLLTYAGAEAIHGYGFIAVFVGGLALRRTQENAHDYHVRLHDFTVEIEHLLMMLLLVLFGGSLAGPLLDDLTWQVMVAGLVILFIVRPLTGMLALLGSSMNRSERAVVSLFGIRGVGSFYYLAYAVNQDGSFGQIDTAWTLVAFIVLTSVFFHGISSGPLLGWMDRRRDALRGKHGRV